MRPTRFGLQGLAFYLVMFLAFYAAPYSNLFFLLLAFLTSLGGAGLVATRRNLRAAEVQLAELPPVPSGTPLEVAATLHAPPPLRFQLEVHVKLAGERGLVGRVALLDGRAQLVLRGAPLPRGVYTVERAFLESSHPFGLARARRPVSTARELFVYPAPAGRFEGRSMVEALDALFGSNAGAIQPSGLRDHRPDEGLRRIHWRASARRDRLVVQEWEGGLDQGLHIVLDRRCSERDLEEALTTLSALVVLAREGKETLRLESQGLSATFGDSHRPWSEALRFLACAHVLPADGEAPPASSPGIARLPRASCPARANRPEAEAAA